MVPKFKVQGTTSPLSSLPHLPWDLTQRSLQALQNLSNHVATREPCPESIPAFRRAAVLLGIFGGRNGELYVIVSKRSSKLRSHAGDTAIPGGRFELNDKDLEDTARREAWEEVGLPIDREKAPKICELRTFLSANELVVSTIVVLLLDPSIKPALNPSEVDAIFSLPLSVFLSHTPSVAERQSLRLGPEPDPTSLAYMPKNEVSGPSDWHTCRDINWLNGSRVRRHTFWDRRNPIRGLTRLMRRTLLQSVLPRILPFSSSTPSISDFDCEPPSDILIEAASIAYGRPPDFSLVAPNQPSHDDLIRMAFTGPLAVKKRRVRPRMTGLPQPVDDDHDSDSQAGSTKVEGKQSKL